MANGSAVDQLLADEQVHDLFNAANNETLWALTDHLGSVRDVVDSNGKLRIHREFDGFGNVLGETHYNASGNPVNSGDAGYVDEAFAFTGRLFDKATGLQNNLNRWYDSTTGRWLSEDPIGFNAGDANLYRYVGNAATANIDPTGLVEGPPYDMGNDPELPGDPQLPGVRPRTGLPPGTIDINVDPRTKKRVHRIKDQLKDEGVGPRSWIGIDPDGNVWGTDPNGDVKPLGPLDDLVMMGAGAAMMGAGWWLFSRGAGGSGVIIADDLTGVGVANDPALIVTGGMMVAGGGLMAIGGAWQWMCGD